MRSVEEDPLEIEMKKKQKLVVQESFSIFLVEKSDNQGHNKWPDGSMHLKM